jgi:hypothetical protein
MKTFRYSLIVLFLISLIFFGCCMSIIAVTESMAETGINENKSGSTHTEKDREKD